jgi:hypothetical protein
MLIVDPPSSWTTVANAVTGIGTFPLSGTDARNAAIFFPRLSQPDPIQGQSDRQFCTVRRRRWSFCTHRHATWSLESTRRFGCTLAGVPALQISMTDPENGQLNPLGVNCLRSFGVAGRVVWGSRTLRGADQLAMNGNTFPCDAQHSTSKRASSEERSGVVFEPNDEPLWAQIRLNVGAFMHNLFRQGAFQGPRQRDAYFVKCDKKLRRKMTSTSAS